MTSAAARNLRVAAVGGFGHAICVFEEWSTTTPEGLEFVGIAPAYAGEDVSGFASHRWVEASGARAFPDVETLLRETSPDILVVSTRPDRIPVMATMGLEHGCHLILEKPVALEREELRTLYQQARKANRRVMGMFTMRSIPALIAARAAIAGGAIGEPVLINSRKSYRWGTRPEWFNERKFYGGTWPWVGIHNLDMAWFLTGRRVLTVTADHANLAHPAMPHCEDVCTGIFEMEGGTRMGITADLCRPESAPTHADEWIRVVGSEGVIEVDPVAGTCRLITANSGPMLLPADDQPVGIFTDFIAAIRKGGEPDDFSAFHLTDAALAARDSADLGEKLRLDHPAW
jgi:predicted dehydrogenase